MESIGIRELRQHASRYLRSVEAGATIQVTDRGRPIALLTPVPSATGIARLRAEGKTIPPRIAWKDRPRPVALPAGALSISEALEQQRRERS